MLWDGRGHSSLETYDYHATIINTYLAMSTHETHVSCHVLSSGDSFAQGISVDPVGTETIESMPGSLVVVVPGTTKQNRWWVIVLHGGP